MKLLTFLLTLTLLVSCGDDGDSPPDEPKLAAATLLNARDVANEGNGSDFELSFTKPDLELVEAFRVFVVKASVAGSFDLATAIQLSSEFYVTLDIGVSGDQLPFSADLSDSEGDPVTEGIDYNFFVLTIGKDNLGGELSDPSNTIKLEQKSAVRTLTQSINAGSGGMDVDAEGNIYMGDFGTTTGGPPGRQILKITPDGVVTTFATGLLGASGNDFDNEGNLYQSNINNTFNSVSKITPEGTVSTFATGFTNPVGIAFDGTSTFYVCNCGANTISKVDMDGNVSSFSVSSLFNCPNGIDVDESGNVYVANFGNGTIVKITPGGTASSFATIPGTNMGHLLIRGDFIYVVARGIHSIYRVDFQGEVTLFAGTGARGLKNGSLDEATFSLPNDMAFSPDGTKIYINDVNGSDPDATVIAPVVIRVIDIVN